MHIVINYLVIQHLAAKNSQTSFLGSFREGITSFYREPFCFASCKYQHAQNPGFPGPSFIYLFIYLFILSLQYRFLSPNPIPVIAIQSITKSSFLSSAVPVIKVGRGNTPTNQNPGNWVNPLDLQIRCYCSRK